MVTYLLPVFVDINTKLSLCNKINFIAAVFVVETVSIRYEWYNIELLPLFIRKFS
jgi:hypothetical protein